MAPAIPPQIIINIALSGFSQSDGDIFPGGICHNFINLVLLSYFYNGY